MESDKLYEYKLDILNKLIAKFGQKEQVRWVPVESSDKRRGYALNFTQSTVAIFARDVSSRPEAEELEFDLEVLNSVGMSVLAMGEAEVAELTDSKSFLQHLYRWAEETCLRTEETLRNAVLGLAGSTEQAGASDAMAPEAEAESGAGSSGKRPLTGTQLRRILVQKAKEGRREPY